MIWHASIEYDTRPLGDDALRVAKPLCSAPSCLIDTNKTKEWVWKLTIRARQIQREANILQLWATCSSTQCTDEWGICFQIFSS